MVKSLIETYKTIKEATNVFRAQAAGLGAAPAAPKPLPMGGSVPGRQVNSTMMAARSSNMQGRPAGSPTQTVNVNRQVTSTGNPNVAGGTAPVKPATTYTTTTGERGQARMDYIRQGQKDRATDARIQAVRRPGGTVPSQSIVRPGERVPGEKVATNAELTAQARRLGAKNVPQNTNMQNSPLNQTRGAGTPTLTQRVNKAINGVADYINKKSGGVDQSIGNSMGDVNPAQDNSVPTQAAGQQRAERIASTGNPNVAGGTATVRSGQPVPPKPTPRPGQPVQTKKPSLAQKPVQRQNVPVKPKVGGTQSGMTASQRAQKNRQIERGITAPGKKSIGLGVTTGKVTRKTATTKRPIGASPLKEENAMNNKQLSEMIKMLRKKRLAEIVGKSSPFDPAHHVATHGEDPQSPNQYVKKNSMAEARTPITSGGAQGKSTLGRLENRFAGQKSRGNQNMAGRSLNTSHLGEQDDVDLGSTDTGKKGKEAETITVNPKDNTASAKGSTDKNTTIKEIKEK